MVSIMDLKSSSVMLGSSPEVWKNFFRPSLMAVKMAATGVRRVIRA